MGFLPANFHLPKLFCSQLRARHGTGRQLQLMHYAPPYGLQEGTFHRDCTALGSRQHVYGSQGPAGQSWSASTCQQHLTVNHAILLQWLQSEFRITVTPLAQLQSYPKGCKAGSASVTSHEAVIASRATTFPKTKLFLPKAWHCSRF